MLLIKLKVSKNPLIKKNKRNKIAKRRPKRPLKPQLTKLQLKKNIIRRSRKKLRKLNLLPRKLAMEINSQARKPMRNNKPKLLKRKRRN